MTEKSLPFLLSSYKAIITAHIAKKHGLDEIDAFRKFLSSETCRMLDNPELEMWEFAPETLAELWECEQETGDPRNSAFLKGE